MSEGKSWDWPPTGSPLNIQQQREEHWTHFDNSVNAVSFGFVATAILISMFLVMAIFERFLRPNSPANSPSGGRRHGDLESQGEFNGKLGHPSPKMSVYARGVSVLMPGEDIPTFIAHPVPVPCPPERIPWPPHQHSSSSCPTTSNPSPSSNSNSNPTTSNPNLNSNSSSNPTTLNSIPNPNTNSSSSPTTSNSSPNPNTNSSSTPTSSNPNLNTNSSSTPTTSNPNPNTNSRSNATSG